MWKRVARILRAEVEHAKRSVGDAVRRTRRGERFAAPPGETTGPAGKTSAARESGAVPDEVRRAFAALELSLDASAEEIRRAWRRLMARYHPDRHASDPELERVATELSRKLTEAYERARAWRAARDGKA